MQKAPAYGLSVARDVEDTRFGPELFFEDEGVVVGREGRHRDKVPAIRGQILFEVAVVDRLVRASLDAVRERARANHIRAEVTLHDRPFEGRNLRFEVVAGEIGFGRDRRFAPVEESSIIRASRHADPTTYASLLIDQNDSLRR